MVALAPRRRAHRTQRIRARPGLGQAQRADRLPGAEAGQIAAPLRFAGVAIDVVRAQIVMRDPGQRERVVPAPERLQHQTGRGEIEPGAAIGFRDGHAEIALRAQFWKGFGRPPFFRVHSGRETVEFAPGEAVRLIEDLALLVAQIERGGAVAVRVMGHRRAECGAGRSERRDRKNDVDMMSNCQPSLRAMASAPRNVRDSM